MIKTLHFFVVIVVFAMCDSSDLDHAHSATLLIDAECLAETKKQIEQNDPIIQAAFEQLILDAEAALLQGPFSVTDKEKLPPSGDKHDYASYSRYWWPDPTQISGLPYIRKDGQTNPESQNPKSSDRQRIGALGKNTETLGLAFYLTGEKKYAIKAAELIRTWFLDEATRMNPNLNHSQCRPGHNEGTKSGILDGRLLTRALEGSLLITQSAALSKTERKKLKEWVKEYYHWLTTDKMALQEAASKNNHGSFYDAQTLYFALYTNHVEDAKKIAEGFVKHRLNSQILKDGSMPEELARTRSLFYSVYNLHAMFIVAHLAEKIDVDIWKSADAESRLKLALDYLLPYIDPNTKWPHPSIDEADMMEMFAILKIADTKYPDGNYLNMEKHLSSEKRNAHRAQLVYPLMR